jgi:hypothetical protein
MRRQVRQAQYNNCQAQYNNYTTRTHFEWPAEKERDSSWYAMDDTDHSTGLPFLPEDFDMLRERESFDVTKRLSRHERPRVTPMLDPSQRSSVNSVHAHNSGMERNTGFSRVPALSPASYPAPGSSLPFSHFGGQLPSCGRGEPLDGSPNSFYDPQSPVDAVRQLCSNEVYKQLVHHRPETVGRTKWVKNGKSSGGGCRDSFVGGGRESFGESSNGSAMNLPPVPGEGYRQGSVLACRQSAVSKSSTDDRATCRKGVPCPSDSDRSTMDASSSMTSLQRQTDRPTYSSFGSSDMDHRGGYTAGTTRFEEDLLLSGNQPNECVMPTRPQAQWKPHQDGAAPWKGRGKGKTQQYGTQEQQTSGGWPMSIF